MKKRRPKGKAGDKTICLPIDEGIDYESLVENERDYQRYLEKRPRSTPNCSLKK
jgi:hypothetical protein